MADYSSQFSISASLDHPRRQHGPHVRRAALFRQPDLSHWRRRYRAPSRATAAPRSSRANRSSAARTSGSPWAACSRARSGATAATSRRTGRPTGCIARRWRCSTALPCASAARTTTRSRAADQAQAADVAQAGHAHQYLRCAIRRRHRHGRPGGGHRSGRRALRGAVPGQLGRGAGAAGAVCIPGSRQADGRRVVRAERILLLDFVGGEHKSARRLDHLHEQLAARAARRQYADGRRVHVDVHLDLRAARRDRRARVVLREGIRHLASRRRAGNRVLAQRLHGDGDGHAVHARRRRVLHRGDAALRRAGAARHRDRALCGRGPGPLRPAAVGSLPVFRHPHLAHAACGALDRDRVARHRALCRAAAGRAASRDSSRSACGSSSSAWS